MSREIIKYIAFYSACTEDAQNRLSILSATNKIDYICSALIRNNYEVEIVSPSWTTNDTGFYKGNISKVADGIYLRTFATFGTKNKIQRLIKYFFSLIQLFLYLLINTKKNESVIVYHSVILTLPIRIAKFIKRFKLVLEVEEIYHDVQSLSKLMKNMEYKAFASADTFIYPTELLNEKINPTNKPYTIIYGTYKVEKESKFKFEDGKIHVVYAGTFDPRKGGTLAAAAAAYLPQNYHLHIIGFGSEEQVKNIQEKIAEVSLKSDATITYDGLLKGKEYIQFLQNCHIGLSTQIPDAEYNETSFPSKILSYMANGLRVVSVRIKAIELSSIGSIIYYYDEQNPKTVANAIISIDIHKTYDSKELIKSLDEEFVRKIRRLLEC